MFNPLDEFLALLTKFNPFLILFNRLLTLSKIPKPARLFALFQSPLNFLRLAKLSNVLSRQSIPIQRAFQKAAAQIGVARILKEVGSKLSAKTKLTFRNRANFEDFLTKGAASQPSTAPYADPHQAVEESIVAKLDKDKIKEIEADRARRREERFKAEKVEVDNDRILFGVGMNVISSAVRKTKFIPLDLYVKSDDIRGGVKIQFLTSNKIYDYGENIKYDDWLEAVNTPGPIDGHGFGSIFLNKTTFMRLGPHERGYLRLSAIRQGYKRAQSALHGTSKKYERYDFVKKLPKLKVRKR